MAPDDPASGCQLAASRHGPRSERPSFPRSAGALADRATRALSGRAGLALLVACGLLLRLLLIGDLRAGERFLLFVPDDSFYYFEIAKNLVEGYGSTFDRLAPTNGYHPLWALLLLPIFALPLDPLTPVLLAMALGATLWTLAAVFLSSIARSFRMPPGARGLLVLLYLFTPYAVAFSINGLETALTVFLHLGFLAWLARNLERPLPRSRRFYGTYGLWCGLLFLARTDAAVFVALVTLSTALAGGARPRLPNRSELRGWALAVAVGALVVSPWVLWNLAVFGEVIQSSGTALTWIGQEYAERARLLSSREMASGSVGNMLQSARDWWMVSGLAWIPKGFQLGWILFAVVLGLTLRNRALAPRTRWLVATIALALLALVGIHAGLRWSVREWYYALPLVLFCAVLALAVQRIAGRWTTLVALAVVAVVVDTNIGFWRFGGLYPQQVGAWASALRHDAQLEEGELLGSTDAGISGYAFERGVVVNLDGLVNSEIREFYARGNLVGYLRERGIRVSYVRAPYLDPIFTGPDRLYLLGAEPFGSSQLYTLLTKEELLARPLPAGPLGLGDPRALTYLGPGWSSSTDDSAEREAFAPRFELYLPLRAGHRYTLVLELRASLPEQARELRVLVNDQPVLVQPITNEWTRMRIELPASAVLDGPNRITFENLRSGSPLEVAESRAAPVFVRSMQIELDE